MAITQKLPHVTMGTTIRRTSIGQVNSQRAFSRRFYALKVWNVLAVVLLYLGTGLGLWNTMATPWVTLHCHTATAAVTGPGTTPPGEHQIRDASGVSDGGQRSLVAMTGLVRACLQEDRGAFNGSSGYSLDSWILTVPCSRCVCRPIGVQAMGGFRTSQVLGISGIVSSLIMCLLQTLYLFVPQAKTADNMSIGLALATISSGVLFAIAIGDCYGRPAKFADVITQCFHDLSPVCDVTSAATTVHLYHAILVCVFIIACGVIIYVGYVLQTSGLWDVSHRASKVGAPTLHKLMRRSVSRSHVRVAYNNPELLGAGGFRPVTQVATISGAALGASGQSNRRYSMSMWK